MKVRPVRILRRWRTRRAPRIISGTGRRTAQGMDVTWVTERIALGGGIWNAKNMEELARSGVTHVLDMQIEFDDTALGEAYEIKVLWNPTDDDFLPKPAAVLERGVGFAREALNDPGARKKFQVLGLEIPKQDQLSPEALGDWQKAEIAKWWPMIKAANVKIE